MSALLTGACNAKRRALADLVIREVVVGAMRQGQVKECEVVMGFDGGHYRIEVHDGTSFGALEKDRLPPGERREESYGLAILYAPSEGWAIVGKRRKTT